MAAALATALFGVYADVDTRVRAEFAGYGANLTVSGPVPLRALDLARESGATAAPFFLTTGMLAGQTIAIEQVDQQAARELIRYWHVEGTREGCLAGVNLAQRFHLKIGSEAANCRITGILTTGAAEDNELILPFAGTANLIGIRAPGDRLESLRDTLQRAYPATQVRVVQAVADTETNVVRKIRIVLFLLLALILVITTMSVSSNFSELVMERAREIGILKAIGAAEQKIAALFLTESILLALSSALIGYAAGIVIAGWIGKSVFSVPFAIHIDVPVFLLAIAVTLVVALAATALAAGSIWRIQPARILRGE